MIKIESKHNNKKYVIKEDLSKNDFNILVYNEAGECIADYVEDDLADAINYCNDEFGVAIGSWENCK